MASVTIPGAGSSTITETFGNTANLQLATSDPRRPGISQRGLAVLNVTTVREEGMFLGLPRLTTAGEVNELVITAAGELHHTGRISGCTRLRRGSRPDYCAA